MTRNEFLSMLSSELKKNNVSDAADIISEYEQHFAFKMADGFTEEEIAKKLGNPAEIASQFEGADENKGNKELEANKGNIGKKTVTLIGLYFADFFVGAFGVLLVAWELVMVALSVGCAAIAVSLFAGTGPLKTITPMPYQSAFIMGLAFAALAVLAAVSCVYFAAFIRQLMRSYGRFHYNTIAAVSCRGILPPVAAHPQLSAKTNRWLRTVALFSLALFAACSVLGIIVSMISSGALEFWHAWGWFGYTG